MAEDPYDRRPSSRAGSGADWSRVRGSTSALPYTGNPASLASLFPTSSSFAAPLPALNLPPPALPSYAPAASPAPTYDPYLSPNTASLKRSAPEDLFAEQGYGDAYTSDFTGSPSAYESGALSVSPYSGGYLSHASPSSGSGRGSRGSHRSRGSSSSGGHGYHDGAYAPASLPPSSYSGPSPFALAPPSIYASQLDRMPGLEDRLSALETGVTDYRHDLQGRSLTSASLGGSYTPSTTADYSSYSSYPAYDDASPYGSSSYGGSGY